MKIIFKILAIMLPCMYGQLTEAAGEHQYTISMTSQIKPTSTDIELSFHRDIDEMNSAEALIAPREGYLNYGDLIYHIAYDESPKAALDVLLDNYIRSNIANSAIASVSENLRLSNALIKLALMQKDDIKAVSMSNYTSTQPEEIETYPIKHYYAISKADGDKGDITELVAGKFTKSDLCSYILKFRDNLVQKHVMPDNDTAIAYEKRIANDMLAIKGLEKQLSSTENTTKLCYLLDLVNYQVTSLVKKKSSQSVKVTEKVVHTPRTTNTEILPMIVFLGNSNVDLSELSKVATEKDKVAEKRRALETTLMTYVNAVKDHEDEYNLMGYIQTNKFFNDSGR